MSGEFGRAARAIVDMGRTPEAVHATTQLIIAMADEIDRLREELGPHLRPGWVPDTENLTERGNVNLTRRRP